MTRASASIVISTLVALSGSARAQPAEAEILFRDGRALIKAHKLAEGCAKLAASERIESSVGTLLNLGDCREALGQNATAWAMFKKAEAAARRAGNDLARMTEAHRRADKLEPMLATLVVTVGSPSPSEVVHRAGELVDPATWGTALPVDPGKLEIVAEAPGRVPWHGTVTIDTILRHQVVAIPALALAPLPPPPRAPMPAPLVESPPSTLTFRAHRTWSPTRGVATVLGVAGLAAVATGVYFGTRANDLSNRANDRCPLAACADPTAVRWASEAHSDATRANLLYAGGGAAIVAATVLWFVGRPSDELVIVPTASADRVGLALVGTL